MNRFAQGMRVSPHALIHRARVSGAWCASRTMILRRAAPRPERDNHQSISAFHVSPSAGTLHEVITGTNMQGNFQFRRPSGEDLKRAHGKTVPDLIAPNLKVLFCGINPGLYSGATGLHFARPGNRFWPALYAAGFTARLLHPSEGDELLAAGYGITAMVRRATATAAELDDDEYRAGKIALEKKVRKYKPRWVALVGLGAYRAGFEKPHAKTGRQEERIGSAGLWVLPSSSGLNANHQLPQLIEMFKELRLASE